METPNAVSLSTHLRALGMPARDITRIYRTFNAGAPVFREQSEDHDA